jgi:hypothetical protein
MARVMWRQMSAVLRAQVRAWGQSSAQCAGSVEYDSSSEAPMGTHGRHPGSGCSASVLNCLGLSSTGLGSHISTALGRAVQSCLLALVPAGYDESGNVKTGFGKYPMGYDPVTGTATVNTTSGFNFPAEGVLTRPGALECMEWQAGTRGQCAGYMGRNYATPGVHLAD